MKQDELWAELGAVGGLSVERPVPEGRAVSLPARCLKQQGCRKFRLKLLLVGWGAEKNAASGEEMECVGEGGIQASSSARQRRSGVR